MIAAGLGFRSGTGPGSLADALSRAARGRRVDLLAVPQDRAEEAGLALFAARLGLPLVAVPPEAIRGVETATHSPRLLASRGTGSVAEAAALAAAGPGARLLAPRSVSADRRATCALAEGEGR